MKYIMVETQNGQKMPFIFPDMIVHEDMFTLVSTLLRHGHNLVPKIVSAGFVDLGVDVLAFGESETLRVASKEEDAYRMVLGEAVSHSPDSILAGLMDRLILNIQGNLEKKNG